MRNFRAFTLVEMLSVLTIVVALAALIFPTLSRSRLSAKAIHCMSNLKQISLATSLYQSDFDDHYPQGIVQLAKTHPKLSFGRPEDIDVEKEPVITVLLQPYLGSLQILQCPVDQGLKALWGDFPLLYPANGGSSYFFGECYRGETSSTWKEPSLVLWSTNGSPYWHSPQLNRNDIFSRETLGLAMDGHVQTFKDRSTPSCLE